MPTPDRRTLLRYAAGLAAAAISPRLFAQDKATEALKPLTGGVAPIGKAERADRLAGAQAMMQRRGDEVYRLGLRSLHDQIPRLCGGPLPTKSPP